MFSRKCMTGYEVFVFLLHKLHQVFGDIMSYSYSVNYCSDNKDQCEANFSSVGLLKHSRAFTLSKIHILKITVYEKISV